MTSLPYRAQGHRLAPDKRYDISRHQSIRVARAISMWLVSHPPQVHRVDCEVLPTGLWHLAFPLPPSSPQSTIDSPHGGENASCIQR